MEASKRLSWLAGILAITPTAPGASCGCAAQDHVIWGISWPAQANLQPLPCLAAAKKGLQIPYPILLLHANAQLLRG